MLAGVALPAFGLVVGAIVIWEFLQQKTELADLAIGGAPPAFAEPLHVGRPNIGDRARLLERINEALDRRWLTNNGPLVQELEKRIAAYVGVMGAGLLGFREARFGTGLDAGEMTRIVRYVRAEAR